MATDLHHEPSFASLISGIIEDAQALFKQEAALARREIADEINKTKQAAASLGAGLGVAALGVILLTLMVVQLLHEEAGLRLWLSYLIVGGALAIVGGVLFMVGRARASTISLVPKQTMQTMKENVQWIRNQT
jgi:hypothetical protein